MTTPISTAQRPARPAARDGFAQLLRAEWTKFRTVRGWVVGMIVAALVMVLVGLFAAGNSHIGCGGGGGPQRTGRACLPHIPIGPGGEVVTDSFYFVHQPLAGNGSITVRMTALTGLYASGNSQGRAGQGPQAGMKPGLQPWSKAGLIIKESTRQGSAYAAIMVTGGHGVRMQYDYTHDLAGWPGAVSAAAPRWLRLTRAGDTITGSESADGRHWTRLGVADLPGLSATVQAGLFSASPQHVVTSPFFGGSSSQGGPSLATAAFDRVGTSGRWPRSGWTGGVIGGGISGSYPVQGGGYHQAGGRLVVTGSGDIAPVVVGAGAGFPAATIEQHLVGAFAGLIAMVVVATMFITAEYRRGLIRTTLAASPRRGRVLAAKALVIGSVAFVAGLAAAVVALLLGARLARNQGSYVLPVSWLTEVRVVAGTAALLAVATVLALALGAVLRRSAAVVTVAIVTIVLPYILAVASVLPVGAADWLLRLTPAAAFAIQQSTPRYPQVTALYSPSDGYFPLAPWAGFAVLCGYAVLALGLAVYLLRRRDA
jgi:ABC-type transport system involved in multi-copper enzyme maturation permease subunit